MGKIAFYYIDKSYLYYLKNVENSNRGFTCVPDIEYSNNEKFFYGTVLNIDGINYYVPVSSKTKGKQDDILIRNKENKIIGALRFNYMLPVPNKCLTRLVLGSHFSESRIIRIKQELAFCNRNRNSIQDKALKTYNRITKLSIQGLNDNSCDFKLLENAYIVYCHDNDFPLSKELQEKYAEISGKGK